MTKPGIPRQDFSLFLQWALPRIRLRWKGFKRVQNQVRKRIRKRMEELELRSLEEYKLYLENHDFEWDVLDHLCQITISRFYRDRRIQEKIQLKILPELASKAVEDNRRLDIWTCGSAGGEETYTLSLMLHFNILPRHPDLNYSIEGLEMNPKLVRRAKIGCYGKSSLKELPDEWLEKAFDASERFFCLKDGFKINVFFHLGDIRKHAFSTKFDLVLCRYLVATYYDKELQLSLFRKIGEQIHPGGYLVLGSNEKLPDEVEGLHLVSKGIYKRLD